MKRYCGLRSGNGTASSFAEIGSSEGLSTAGSSGEAGPTVDAGAAVDADVTVGVAAGAGFAPVTTEILPAPEFYFAEDYHQQYLAKNPRGYCGLGGTGVSCPIGTGVSAA